MGSTVSVDEDQLKASLKAMIGALHRVYRLRNRRFRGYEPQPIKVTEATKAFEAAAVTLLKECKRHRLLGATTVI